METRYVHKILLVKSNYVLSDYLYELSLFMSGLGNKFLNRFFRFTAMGGGSSDEDDNSTTDSNEWSDA